MQVDATQIIMGAMVLVGGLVATLLSRRSARETSDQQDDANKLKERVEAVESLMRSLDRAGADIENERRWRREDAVEHDAELGRERAIVAQLRVTIREQHDDLVLLQRAVRDEAMRAAVQPAIDLRGDLPPDPG